MRKRSKIALLVVSSTLFAQSPKNVWSGVFTDAQVKRGEAVYGAKCAKCHEGADVDGPPLTGDPFIDRWREDSLNTLFSFIKENMPQDAAGELTTKEYVDVLTFLLSENHIPAGNQELTAEAIPATMLVGKDGPKPLPANALVKAVGCLSQGADHAWTLTRAGELARVRAADEISAAEIATSTGKALGSQIFELPNLEELGAAFAPQANLGHKVIVKGVLARRGAASRINVLGREVLQRSVLDDTLW